jgi:hypothetical protein
MSKFVCTFLSHQFNFTFFLIILMVTFKAINSIISFVVYFCIIPTP